MAGLVSPDTRWWAVDKIILAYFAAACVLVAAYAGRLPDAGPLIAAHVLAALLLWVEVRRPNRASFVFRHWYALPYVAACYKEMAIVIPATGPWNADAWLAGLDYRLWGAHPTV